MKKSLIVGVTGRRHIVPDSLPAIERATRLFMQKLGALDYETVAICTGLAIGADTLAARAVLEEKERDPQSKLRLRAVLPMPRSDYDNDFKADELAEFRDVLERCDEVVELPTNADASGAFDRTAQYVKLRDYLVAESDVLLAYWSGDASVVKNGGTVDVVLSKTREFMSGRPGAIFSVATPELLRIKNDDGTKTYVPEELASPGWSSLATFGDPDALLNFQSLIN